jgi:hypothetical protein
VRAANVHIDVQIEWYVTGGPLPDWGIFVTFVGHLPGRLRDSEPDEATVNAVHVNEGRFAQC